MTTLMEKTNACLMYNKNGGFQGKQKDVDDAFKKVDDTLKSFVKKPMPGRCIFMLKCENHLCMLVPLTDFSSLLLQVFIYGNPI